MAHQEEASKVPVLVAPREQAIVRGDRVTFLWKPVKGARQYRLQVARESTFNELIYESSALQRTEFTLRDGIPVDEDTYYWRIVVEDEQGRVHGEDNVESFVSASAAAVEKGIVQPGQDEDLGPLERLVRGAAAEAAAEVTHSPRWVAEEDELGVEHEGIEAGEILGLVIAIAVALGLSVFTLFQYVDLTAQAARAEATGRSGYPELREHQLHALQRLTQYEAIGNGRYRIPIDRAMELMANEARQGAEYSSELELRGTDR